MFSARHAARRALLAGMAAGAGLAVAGAAHAQAVVVRSNGPSMAQFPQGKRLPANAKVTLKAGDRVTVLDRAGTRVLVGPNTFTLDSTVARDQGGAAMRASGIIAGSTAPRVRTGAVRGAVLPPPEPSPGRDAVWYVDVTKGGTYCVASPSALVLWRPNRDQEAMGKLTALSGGKTVPLTWRRGNPLKPWPSELPVVDGASYAFSDPVGPTVRITTRFVGPVPADQLELAGLLGDRGCTVQLDVLANAAGPSASGG